LLRYELPGLHAFNFVMEDVLGGGGIASLRSDPQVCNETFYYAGCIKKRLIKLVFIMTLNYDDY